MTACRQIFRLGTKPRLRMQCEVLTTRSSQQRHPLRVMLDARPRCVLSCHATTNQGTHPNSGAASHQRPLKNSSPEVNAQTVPRLHAPGGYYPSYGRLRRGQHSLPSSSVPSFHFRPLREADLRLLREWLLRPHVAAWWGPAQSIAELRSDYLLSVPNATRAYIAHMDGKPAGFIQVYVLMGCGEGWWESETDPGARGIDQFLAEADQLGRGLGRAMIRAFVDRLFSDPTVTMVQTDPDPRNERAIRCYAAADFYPVGPIITPDGDALLMRCKGPRFGRSIPQNVAA
jgi:RimJ/RimL family protein N-acetyltransferase